MMDTPESPTGPTDDDIEEGGLDSPSSPDEGGLDSPNDPDEGGEGNQGEGPAQGDD